MFLIFPISIPIFIAVYFTWNYEMRYDPDYRKYEFYSFKEAEEYCLNLQKKYLSELRQERKEKSDNKVVKKQIINVK